MPKPKISAEERRRLAEERTTEFIRRIVDAAPPLTEEQKHELALLLAPQGSWR